jgi:hypothetical protein
MGLCPFFWPAGKYAGRCSLFAFIGVINNSPLEWQPASILQLLKLIVPG